MNLDDYPGARYFVALDGEPEREVSRAEYIAAERAHGFTSRPDMLATLSWTNGDSSGRVEIVSKVDGAG